MFLNAAASSYCYKWYVQVYTVEKGAGIGKTKMNFHPTWDCAIEYLAFIALTERLFVLKFVLYSYTTFYIEQIDS